MCKRGLQQEAKAHLSAISSLKTANITDGMRLCKAARSAECRHDHKKGFSTVIFEYTCKTKCSLYDSIDSERSASMSLGMNRRA